MSRVLRNRVQKKFRMRGYTLRVEALTEILSFIERFSEDAVDEATDLLLDELHHLSCRFISFFFLLVVIFEYLKKKKKAMVLCVFVAVRSSILDREAVNQVVSSLLEADAAAEENPNNSTGFGGSALRIINTFDILKFRYDPVKKAFFE